MKLLHAKIKGLIGLKRGSDLDVIDIDFTKCKNKLVLIVGGNGAGKTTLRDALSPLPDPQSMYIQGVEGYKELEYSCNNVIYRIFIQYPVNRNGERTTTKAYIDKIIGNSITELNPNGNVTSYKEVLYTEFRLDSNFMALTSLSIEDKGIVGKTPAERKKYVGGIISSIEVYNNIYKSLNKRSSIFRSMINTLVSKIDTIGNQENIEASLMNMNNRIKKLSDERDALIKKAASAESVIQTIDPNNQMQQQYTELSNQLASIKTQIDTIKMFISKYNVDPYKNIIKDLKSCSEYCETTKEYIIVAKNKIDVEKDRLQTMLKQKEEDAKTIAIKTNKINSLRSQYNFEELFRELKTVKDRIDNFKKILSDMGISEDNLLTKDELISGLSILKSIKEQIDTVRSFEYDDSINAACQYIYDISSLNEKISNCRQSANFYKEKCLNHETTICKCGEDAERLWELEKRPKECNITTCQFVEGLLKLAETNPLETAEKEEKELQLDTKSLELAKSEEKYYSKLKDIVYSIKNILNMIESNKLIINKLPHGDMFTDTSNFLTALKSGNTFSYINDIYKYIDYANAFEQYSIDKERLIKLVSEHKIYKNRKDIIDEISSELKELNKGMSNIVEEIESKNKVIHDMEIALSMQQSTLQIVTNVKSKYEELENLATQYTTIENDIKAISANMKAIEQAIQDANTINSSILIIDNELKPIKEDRDSMRYSLDRLKEYEDELAQYKAKFEKIETIKKYSTPTKDGIQNLFIDVYMGQTIAMANDLLSMFFNGKLKLGKYVIGENEFRIPCTSAESNLPNDDISSCSGGERSIISLILSGALLQQSSTLYNIFRLDEIDGTLDQMNRSMFITAIFLIIEILNIETCIMISHSSEATLDNVDIIKLSGNDNYNINGNIIYEIQ